MPEKSASRGQWLQIGRFVADALKTIAGVSRSFVQRFIDDPVAVERFKQGAIELFKQIMHINPFADERMKGGHNYPSGWQMPSLDQQKHRLQKLFPDLDLSQVDALAAKAQVPIGFDGLAIIPKLSALGEYWGLAYPTADDYGTVVELVLGRLSAQRLTLNYRQGQLTKDYIWLHAEVRAMVEKLEAETLGDVLVLAVNFGQREDGECLSPRAARWEAIDLGQLPLGSAQVGCLLLVMPERLVSKNDLWVDCAGDEYDWDGIEQPVGCPYFCFDNQVKEQLKFFVRFANNAFRRYGSVVAFLGVQN